MRLLIYLELFLLKVILCESLLQESLENEVDLLSFTYNL